MTALLAEDVPGCLFVSGCVSNQGRFYDRFDAVILLSLSVGVLLARVKARVTNPFGKDPADRKRILEDLRTVEPLLRATATTEIDTDRPLHEVVDAVEALAHRVGRTSVAGDKSVLMTAVPVSRTRDRMRILNR